MLFWLVAHNTSCVDSMCWKQLFSDMFSLSVHTGPLYWYKEMAHWYKEMARTRDSLSLHCTDNAVCMDKFCTDCESDWGVSLSALYR